jgi:hypothetical protein
MIEFLHSDLIEEIENAISKCGFYEYAAGEWIRESFNTDMWVKIDLNKEAYVTVNFHNENVLFVEHLAALEVFSKDY